MRNNFRSAIFIFLCLCFAVATQSCSRSTAVQFAEHSPYHSNVTYSSPLLIVLPDDLDKAVYKYTDKSGPFAQYFDIYYGQAMKAEITARFQRMFSQIAVVNEALYEEIEASKSNNAESLEEMNLPSFIPEGSGYLLRFENPRYEIEGNRAIVSFETTFQDRFSGEVLLKGRSTGRGEADAGAPSAETFQKRTLSALSIALMNLTRHIRTSIEGGSATAGNH